MPGDDHSKDRVQWRHDRIFSVTNLLTTITVLVAGMWFIAGQDHRIGLNTQAIQYQALRLERGEADRKRDIDRIDQKLDKIYEYIQEQRR